MNRLPFGVGDFVASFKGDTPGHPFRGNQWGDGSGEVDVTDETTAAYSGQINSTITARDKSGKKVGHLDYSLYQGDIHINMIEVNPEHRRKGIGMKMYDKMISENPGKRVKWGMMTDEGAALKKAIMDKRLGKRT